MEFIQGWINKQFFGISKNDGTFPRVILTTEMEGAPLKFYSVSAPAPSKATQDQLKDYTKPIADDPVRVWMVIAPEPMTEELKAEMFSEIIEDHAMFDWFSFPEYQPPEQFPPFIINDGVFYINTIKKAASGMEMSAIGAKNIAFLAHKYLLKSAE